MNNLDSYIDIPIINIGTKEIMFLDEAINKYHNLVLLGSPGSGKTSLFEKYTNEYKTVRKLSVKEFIKIDTDTSDNVDIVLLDGLDEYRSFKKDKAFVIKELAYKLKKYNCKKVISCRELDWYGDSDSNALKDILNGHFEVFRINALDEELQIKMIKLLDSNIDANEIVEKFSFTGLIKNPQLLKMIVQIYDSEAENLTTKKDIFELFIKKAGKEHNAQYSSIRINNEDIFKYNGYLAFFYMFSDIDSFDDEFFAQISNEEYDIKILKNIAKSKLYTQNTIFIHRTIAEYLCAKFIVDFKLNTNNKIAKERIRTLFVTEHKKIISELRGVYSWIGVLTQDMKYIETDPFYQLIYADNSFFNAEFKKEIIKSIKEYSISNPYFYNAHIKANLDGFYVEEMDVFLITEFKNSIKSDSHYLLLLSFIIRDAQDISSRLKRFIRKKIDDNKISPYIKENLMVHFGIQCKKNILQRLINGDIEDNEYNTFKEGLLKNLYPESISLDKLIEALKKYNKSNMMGQCFYLFETKFDDKYTLLDKLYKNLKELSDSENILTFEKREPFHSIEHFIEDYFVELCLHYKECYSAEEIYEILVHFHSYYSNRHKEILFKAYTKETSEKLETSKELLEELANELFDIFVKKCIETENIDFYGFSAIFSLAETANKSSIFLNNIDENHNEDMNKELFYNAMIHYKDKGLNEYFEKIAKQYSFEGEMERFKNPKKTKWQIESEEMQKKRQAEMEQKRQNSREYFYNKTDDDILNSFDDLKLAYIFISHYRGLIDDDTRVRLKNIFKQLLEKYLYENVANIIQLVPTINKLREIDLIYYEALVVNDDKIKYSNLKKDLQEYLYILCVLQKNVINIDKPEKFIEYIKIQMYDLKILKKVIVAIINDHILLRYINEIYNVDLLKSMFSFFDSEDIQKKIIENLVVELHFSINEDDLKYIYDTYKILEANWILKVKKEELLNQEDIISLCNRLFRFDDYKKTFYNLDSKSKIQLIYNMMNIFNDKKMLKFSSGVQTKYDQTVRFLNDRALTLSNIEELDGLLEKVEKESFWYNYILAEKNIQSQNKANNFNRLKVESLAKFINKNEILNNKDFFTEIYLRFKDIKLDIEDNRNNEKDLFYTGQKSKSENECRDIIVQKLQDRYKDIIVNREKSEANNRADINIRYKSKDFEVQVECKKNDNRGIYDGIENQLIDKYLSSNVEYGIYLIFYFGDKKDIEKMIKKIGDNISIKYKNNIKIIYINMQ